MLALGYVGVRVHRGGEVGAREDRLGLRHARPREHDPIAAQQLKIGADAHLIARPIRAQPIDQRLADGRRLTHRRLRHMLLLVRMAKGRAMRRQSLRRPDHRGRRGRVERRARGSQLVVAHLRAPVESEHRLAIAARPDVFDDGHQLVAPRRVARIE